MAEWAATCSITFNSYFKVLIIKVNVNNVALEMNKSEKVLCMSKLLTLHKKRFDNIIENERDPKKKKGETGKSNRDMERA
jgi:hypothetical protein